MDVMGKIKFEYIVLLFLFFISIKESQTLLDEKHAYLPGDVLIGGLFQVDESNEGECTAEVVPSSVRALEAVKWTLMEINQQNHIPGITIGLKALRTCRLPGRAIRQAASLVEGNQNTSAPVTIGVIGPQYSSEAEKTSSFLSSLSSSNRLVQVLFSATASSLENRQLYGNIFRVVPSDRTQISVMISLLKKLQWNYIAVLYENDTYGQQAYTSLKYEASKESICIAMEHPIHLGEAGTVKFSHVETIVRNLVTDSITGALVFASETTSKNIVSAVKAVAKTTTFDLSFIFSEATGLNTRIFKVDNITVSNTKGSYVVAPPKLVVDGFKRHWRSIFTNMSVLSQESSSNPWLNDVFSSYTGCMPGDNGCGPLSDSQANEKLKSGLFDEYAILSAIVMANMLKNAQSEKCPGMNGLCDDIKTYLFQNKGRLQSKINSDSLQYSGSSLLSNVSNGRMLQFNKNNEIEFDEQFSEYEIHQYQECPNGGGFCLIKVASFINKTVEVDESSLRGYDRASVLRWPNLKTAQCLPGKCCKSCLPHNLSDSVYFVPGDLYVVGVIPIYEKSNDDPVSCGDLRTSHSVEISEGLAFAVSMVNEKYNVFPNSKIGLIILNSCNQVLVIQRKLISLFLNGVRVHDKVYQVRDKILGFVAAYTSGLSVATAEILSKFKFVQVSFSSTAAVLSDRATFPYFARVVTPDDKQAACMANIMHDLRAEYVQILYTEGPYGEGGRDDLKSKALSYGICIANEIEVTTGDYNRILDDLRKFAYAKVVVVFLRPQVLMDVTKSLKDKGLRRREFIFIASESWGKQNDIIKDNLHLEGTITLSLEIDGYKEFPSYLNTIDPVKETQNPWFKAYVEKKYDCYLDGSFNKASRKECVTNLRLANVSGYSPSIWTQFSISAMLSLLNGTHEAMKGLCGERSTSICEEYRSHPDTVYKNVIGQRLAMDSSGTLQPVFDSNGDGNVGYKIYQVQGSQLDKNILEYVQVGKFTLEGHGFQLNLNNLSGSITDYQTKCPHDLACQRCRPNTTAAFLSPTIRENSDRVMVITLSLLLAATIVGLVGVVVCYKLQGKSHKPRERGSGHYFDADDVRRSDHCYASPSEVDPEVPSLPGRTNVNGADSNFYIMSPC